MNSDDRRSGRRAELRVYAQAVGERGLFTVGCRDVSVGGACLAGATFPGHGELKLFLPMPERTSGRRRLCLLRAGVRWRRDGLIGVKFIEPSAENLERLRDYVRHVA